MRVHPQRDPEVGVPRPAGEKVHWHSGFEETVAWICRWSCRRRLGADATHRWLRRAGSGGADGGDPQRGEGNTGSTSDLRSGGDQIMNLNEASRRYLGLGIHTMVMASRMTSSPIGHDGELPEHRPGLVHPLVAGLVELGARAPTTYLIPSVRNLNPHALLPQLGRGFQPVHRVETWSAAMARTECPGTSRRSSCAPIKLTKCERPAIR